ncbi:TlpA disulfide reductase family protein [Pedobacter frigoris]|uniref:TlpA family protein disulfide reductase n=1 Tax=Pedobacter frigoris TaxID=2571272 RepID=UPI00293011AF|nr:TlpA disulfide reductase family protein [Pedobacter frigoris]
MNRHYILLFILVAFAHTASGQELEISLHENGIYSEVLSIKKEEDVTLCKNFPYKNQPYFSLRSSPYDAMQNLYEKVLDGKWTEKFYKDFVHKNQLDTSYVFKQSLPGNRIYIATAIDELGIKHVMVDANNNRDFGDDKEYVFNLKSQEKKTQNIAAWVDYYDGKAIRKLKVDLSIDPYNYLYDEESYKIEKDIRELDVSIFKISKNLVGRYILSQKAYDITIADYNDKRKDSFRLIIETKDAKTKSITSYSYKPADTIDISYGRYKILKVDDKRLVLSLIGKQEFAGAELNSLAPEITGQDIITSRDFSLKEQLGTYILIDFWGSWCGPCIKAIPELKLAFGKYGKKIKFVSIAFDKRRDLAKVKHLIAQYEMTWTQLLDDREINQGKISDNYKVQEFPTSILIDHNGKVVFRAVGATGLKNLMTYLDEIEM